MILEHVQIQCLTSSSQVECRPGEEGKGEISMSAKRAETIEAFLCPSLQGLENGKELGQT